MQPLTLICNYPNAKIYTLRVNLSGLTVLHVELGLEWALLVAYNRGKMESVRHSPIYNYFADLSKGYDMIAGYIADADRVQLKQEGAANRSKGIAMAEEICRKYRRKGGISGELPASDVAVRNALRLFPSCPLPMMSPVCPIPRPVKGKCCCPGCPRRAC